MSDSERAVHGDFHVIKMGGLFHVAFRPDADPEWFRIIGTFFTYERAYSYCDIERVSVWTYKDSETGEIHAEGWTGDEELAGLRSPPIADAIPEGWMASRDGCADMVRNICDDASAAVPPHPDEDFSDQPGENEAPKDYRQRVHEEAVAAICHAADALPPEPELPPDPKAEALNGLTDNQWSVLRFFQGRAEPGGTVNASQNAIASEAGVARGSITYFLETLERKGFIDIVERGGADTTGTYRLNDPATREDKGPKCRTCGGPCSPGSKQCSACYRGELKVVSA